MGSLQKPADLVNEPLVRQYLNMLFSLAPDDDTSLRVCVRGIGEKGTDQEGVFRENLFFPLTPALGDNVVACVRRWSEHGVASYILPGLVRGEAATTEDVTGFGCVVVDIDSGDTNRKRDYLAKALGWPTMIVASGGITDTGNVKLHMYWQLDDWCEDPKAIADLRMQIAAKGGGDWQFKKPAQVIRIPGSVHAKGGKAARVELLQEDTAARYRLGDLQGKADAMGHAPGVEKPQAGNVLDFTARLPSRTSSGAMDFSAGAGMGASGAVEALMSDITEGGDEDRNRWTEFSKVAGHYLHCVRLGQMDIDQACDYTRGWMAAHMTPPWPEQRFMSEFKGLLNHDIKSHGPLPAPKVMPSAIPVQTVDGKTLAPMAGLMQWDVSNWAMAKAPERRFLVPGWIMAGVPHTLAAEGGAGKTFMALDLGLKLAAAGGGHPNVTWLGEPVTDEALNGAVVIITAEDDQNELHIRLENLDPDGSLRAAAAGRLRLLPLVNAGGVFKLVRYDRSTGEPESSQKWDALVDAIGEIEKQTGKVTAVIIDTLAATLHGEDISSKAVTEYYTEASRVCGQFKAALIITHHVRKQKAGEPIRTPDEMAEAIRGSGAVQFSSRVVMGLWHAHDYSKMLRAGGFDEEPKTCYKLAVVKGNNPELSRDVKVLVRAESGNLLDMTNRISKGLAMADSEAKAWLEALIGYYADHGYALTNKEKATWNTPTDANVASVLERGKPPIPGKRSAAGIYQLVDELISEGRVVTGAGRTSNKAANQATMLDVPGGRLVNDSKRGGQPYIRRGWDEVTPFDFNRYTYDMTIGKVRPI